MKYCFIYNPSANRGKSGDRLEQLNTIVKDSWVGSTIKVSQEQDDIARLAREAAGKYDVVVACGGDGTIRETAVGLLNQSSTALGILPIGSGNDFSKTLGIPKSLDRVLTILKNGNFKKIDIGKCNDEYFLNTLGIGFDGLTNFYAQQINSLSGKWLYTLAALKANFVLDPPTVNLIFDGQELHRKVLMCTVANGKIEGGNFRIAPQASIEDGKLDFILVDPVSKWRLPLLLPYFLTDQGIHLKPVHHYQITELQVKLEKPVPIHADGEQLDCNQLKLDIRVIPAALKIIVP